MFHKIITWFASIQFRRPSPQGNIALLSFHNRLSRLRRVAVHFCVVSVHLLLLPACCRRPLPLPMSTMSSQLPALYVFLPPPLLGPPSDHT